MEKELDIKKLIENILNSMGITYNLIEEVSDPITQKKIFKIKSQEGSLLIGESGEVFNSLSHLIRMIAGKGLKDKVDFSIDVNDYKSSVVEKLKMTAGILANRARDMKTDVEMEPMSSYERLVVHGTLSGQPNIKTESVGEGKNRHLVIRYVENSL